MKNLNNYVSNTCIRNDSAQTSVNMTPSTAAGAGETPALPADAGVHGASPFLLRNGVVLQMTKSNVYEVLSDCVDSMLFDSDTTIAGIAAQSADGRFSASVALMVRGEVSVTFKGVTYKKPSQFPQELKDRIRKFPGEWDCMSDEAPEAFEPDVAVELFDPDTEDEDDLYISCNNWFEYLYTVIDGEDTREDGICCDEDLARMTNDDLETAMMTVAKEVVDMWLEDTDVPRQNKRDAYIKALTQIGSKMYSCNECGRNLRETDKVITCADCAAIICESCVRSGRVEEHECEDEDIEF